MNTFNAVLGRSACRLAPEGVSHMPQTDVASDADQHFTSCVRTGSLGDGHPA